MRAALPEAAAEALLDATNRPYCCLLALTGIVRSMRTVMPDFAVRRCEDTLAELGGVAGGCERILSTPMPLSYTRFTGRAIMIFLAALPLALCDLLGFSAVPAVFASAYFFLGIDECGLEIEEPFAILPLKALCDAVKRDVGIADRESQALWGLWPGGLGPAHNGPW